MNWIDYDQDKWHNQPLPPERRYVLCQIAAKTDKGLPPSVAVGCMRFAAGDPTSPMFVIPGVGGKVVAWCDCLGDDFNAPLWNTPKQPPIDPLWLHDRKPEVFIANLTTGDSPDHEWKNQNPAY